MTLDPSPAPLTGAEARRAARNAAALAVARIVSSGALFLWQLLLGRVLGDTQFGIYSTVGALIGIGAAFTAFGMSLIVIRDVARAPSKAGHYLSSTLFLQTLLAALAYAGLNGAALLLGYGAEIRALVGIAAISLFVDALGTMAYDQLLAQERMASASVVEVGHLLLRIAAALAVLAAGYGLIGVYVVTILMGAGRASALWVMLARTGVRPAFPLDRSLARDLLINSAPLALSAFINMAYTQVDKLMSTSVLTAADTGHFNAAFVIVVGVVELLSTTVIVALYPMMSRAYTPDGDNRTFYFIIEKVAFFTLLLGVAVGLVLSLYAAEVTVPLFGADFRPAADVLRALIWYAALTMIVNVYAQGMMVQNRQRRYVALRTGGFVVKLTANLVLLPRVGVIGAALASVLAEMFVLLIAARQFPPESGWSAAARRLVKVAAAALIAGAIMVLLSGVHAVLGIAGGLAAYVAVLLLIGVLAADDWDLLYRLAAAMPGGRLILRYWKREVTINW